jgi:tetratricopeptide (TPR) repeat protein
MSIGEALIQAYRHWDAGQADQAEQLCRRVLQEWPGQGDALHLLGLMAHAWGNPDLAIEYLQQACAAPRAPARYHSNLCEMLRQRGRLAEAETAGRRAVTADVAIGEGWNNLGIVLQESGKLEESQACLERAVALQPQSHQAQGNLGNTFKKLGALARARLQYDRALAIFPDFAEAHSNLAVVLNDIGQAEEGLAHAERAIELNPRLVDAYINAAMIEAGLGRRDAALHRLGAALVFAPQHPSLLLAHVDMLLRLDRLDEALEACRKLIALKPDYGEAYNVQGLILQAANRDSEAITALDRAATHLASPAIALNNKAILLMELGRRGEALALLDHVLETEPTFVPAWFNRADVKTFRIGDPDIAAMEALLRSDRAQGISDRMCLLFALGKAYLDADAADLAFTRLAEGNRLKRSTITFDIAATESWMASIATGFDAELLKAAAGHGAASEQPIFVIGMPRSGTTLVEQILSAHPQIHGAGELNTVRQLTERAAVVRGALLPYPEFAQSLDAKAWRQLGEDYLSTVRNLAPEAVRIADKMPSNFLYAGLIHLMLPQARFVHCRRDPVDVGLSCYQKLFRVEQQFAYDLQEIGRFHRAYQRLMEHWRSVLPGEVLFELDYETLVADLDREARRLVAFCDLSWDDRVLRYRENTRPVRTASMNLVRDPIDRSRAGRWRAYREHLKPLLAALGEA